MKRTSLEVLSCPHCHGELNYVGASEASIRSGFLACPRCKLEFKVIDGIPHFIEPENLTGFNRRFARMYDRFSWGYRLGSRAGFTLIGMNEETARREITDRLQFRGGKVLEVSIGPGLNLPYLVNRSDVGEIFGLDISLGQLKRCQSYAAKKRWDIELFLGNGEQLPFRDESFEGVFHVGGINFFNDKKSAVNEMIRVTKPGARILIADEHEKGVKGYEKLFPGFRRHFGNKREKIVPPFDLVPGTMLEKRFFDIWKGWFYCIEFRKP